MRDEYSEMDFTERAWDSLYEAVDNSYFRDRDAVLIYRALEKRLRLIPFGEYLKRYIYKKAGIETPYKDVPLRDYQIIIRDSFDDNHTPPSFSSTTAKMSALTKNWLTQQTVKRNVVFLLGFGLSMSAEDVNTFLTKVLCEQGINAKDPFEVICWYCFKNGYSYPKFQKLWDIYSNTPANSLDPALLYGDYTLNVRHSMKSIDGDAALIAMVTKLKTSDNVPFVSDTMRRHFEALYGEARDIAAELYNSADHSNRVYCRDDISGSDLEHIISSAIPVDRHGNLTPGKESRLNSQFAGKRFNKQHISNVLARKSEATRFDLITLNFFCFSQRLDDYPNEKARYTAFIESTNKILDACFLAPLYVANPYECFVLMCILSDDPLGTYADVWELSYKEDRGNLA